MKIITNPDDYVLIISSSIIEHDIIIVDKRKRITREYFEKVIEDLFLRFTKYREMDKTYIIRLLNREAKYIHKKDLNKYIKYDKLIFIEGYKIYSEKEYILQKIFWK